MSRAFVKVTVLLGLVNTTPAGASAACPKAGALNTGAYVCNFMVGLSLLLFTEDEIICLKEIADQDQRTIQKVRTSFTLINDSF